MMLNNFGSYPYPSVHIIRPEEDRSKPDIEFLGPLLAVTLRTKQPLRGFIPYWG